MTPIDLFFSYYPFRVAVEQGAIEAPFADTTIRVLSATHLSVCKVVFDRPRDWVDIEAMLDASANLDASEIMRRVGRTGKRFDVDGEGAAMAFAILVSSVASRCSWIQPSRSEIIGRVDHDELMGDKRELVVRRPMLVTTQSAPKVRRSFRSRTIHNKHNAYDYPCVCCV